MLVRTRERAPFARFARYTSTMVPEPRWKGERVRYANNMARTRTPFRPNSRIQRAYEQMQDGELHDLNNIATQLDVDPSWLRLWLHRRGIAAGKWKLENDQITGKVRMISTIQASASS
jgi:hypothetical protein